MALVPVHLLATKARARAKRPLRLQAPPPRPERARASPSIISLYGRLMNACRCDSSCLRDLFAVCKIHVGSLLPSCALLL